MGMSQVKDREEKRTKYCPDKKLIGNDIISEEKARGLCKSVVKNLRLLIEKRDMTINEVKLVLAIENSRTKEKITNTKQNEAVLREDVSLAFLEVVAGCIPKDRFALCVLAREMDNWSMISKNIDGRQKDLGYTGSNSN